MQLQWLKDHENRVEQSRTDAKFLSSIKDQNIESSILKMFLIVPNVSMAMWLVFSTEELCAYKQALNAQKN